MAINIVTVEVRQGYDKDERDTVSDSLQMYRLAKPDMIHWIYVICLNFNLTI